MPHPVLMVNPFDVLLRLHQTGTAIDKDFSFWLRAYRDPPVRTVGTLIDKCPRLDWLFWFLEQLVKLEYLDAALVIGAGHAVYRQLELLKAGNTYSQTKMNMPHTEGLLALRTVLARQLYNGG